MGVEKFIRGKHDDCKHEGRASERRRIQAAEWELKEYLTMDPGEDYYISASGNTGDTTARVSDEDLVGTENRFRMVRKLAKVSFQRSLPAESDFFYDKHDSEAITPKSPDLRP